MKRTYAVTIDIPTGFETVENWKVQNLIATQVERAVVHPKGQPHDRSNLKVTDIELISEEQDTFESPLDELIGALFVNWSR